MDVSNQNYSHNVDFLISEMRQLYIMNVVPQKIEAHLGISLSDLMASELQQAWGKG